MASQESRAERRARMRRNRVRARQTEESSLAEFRVEHDDISLRKGSEQPQVGERQIGKAMNTLRKLLPDFRKAQDESGE